MPEPTLHYKLLYRWVGRSVETAGLPAGDKKSEKLNPFTLKPLTVAQRNWYFERIRDALHPQKGLLATLPTETLGGKGDSQMSIELPCICLTQISLTNAETHCRRYGRLGFGFTKRAILKLRGRPVAYLRGGKTDLNVQRLLRLRAWLQKDPAARRPLQDFEYLRHFYKRIEYAVPEPAAKKTSEPQPKRARRSAPPVDPLLQKAYAKPKALDYAEEQEWRLVIPKPERHPAHPDIAGARWVPVKPGEQLQVLVVPDNVLYQRVLADRDLMHFIAPENRKPIQVISWESIRRI